MNKQQINLKITQKGDSFTTFSPGWVGRASEDRLWLEF